MNVKKLKKAIRETAINPDCMVSLIFEGEYVANLSLNKLGYYYYDTLKELEDSYYIQSSFEFDRKTKKLKSVYWFNYKFIQIKFDKFKQFYI